MAYWQSVMQKSFFPQINFHSEFRGFDDRIPRSGLRPDAAKTTSRRVAQLVLHFAIGD
jgi:hypothetical protein